VVLAAGRGTRMKSERSKVLHTLLGWPMVAYPVAAALDAGCHRVALVTGYQGEAVLRVARAALGSRAKTIVRAEQPEPRGTGHAVQCALDKTVGYDEVLILCGDTPALDEGTLRQLIAVHRTQGAAVTMTSFKAPDPTGYGRVIRNDAGHPTSIVEHVDCTEEQRLIDEVNAGIYMVGRAHLMSALDRIRANNNQGELYLTDIVSLLASDGEVVRCAVVEDPTIVAGVNDRAQLAAMEGVLAMRHAEALMREGVTIHRPETTVISRQAQVGRDTSIGSGVQLRGKTVIGEGCIVDVGCVLTNCILGDGVHLKPYVVAADSTLGDKVTAGPFAHLRPGTVLRRAVKVGNFVETKKVVMEEGAKASHLSYLGDATIGRNTNVGAGTITCNYDGFNKHHTTLGDNVFVGSDTQLVAPVTVGDNVNIAAGTTVTKDVPPGALVLSRTKQTVREGYYNDYRRPQELAKASAKAMQAKLTTDKG